MLRVEQYVKILCMFMTQEGRTRTTDAVHFVGGMAIFLSGLLKLRDLRIERKRGASPAVWMMIILPSSNPESSRCWQN